MYLNNAYFGNSVWEISASQKYLWDKRSQFNY